jgi:hypothetical protein
VAFGRTVGRKNNGVAAAITDGRAVPSIKYKTPALVLLDKGLNGFGAKQQGGFLPFGLHGSLLGGRWG